jgi:hypothetical protein
VVAPSEAAPQIIAYESIVLKDRLSVIDFVGERYEQRFSGL